MIWTLPIMLLFSCPEGIDFTKMMRKEEFEYDWMKITADAARNLFSWNSKCAATPFEISRMPAPAIRALFTACFIANGDYMVSVRKNDKGEKVFEIDDSVQSANGADDGSPRYGTGLIMEVIFWLLIR